MSTFRELVATERPLMLPASAQRER